MADLSALYATHLANLLQRHRQLMAQNDLEYLVIPSGAPIRVYQDDMDYPFKSSFHFRTYLPLPELAHSFLIIGLTGKPTLIYFQPEDYWHTPPSDPEGIWPEHFDIKIVAERNAAKALLPADSNRVAILGEESETTETLTKAVRNPQALINAIYWQRAYKSDYEIACMVEANKIATRAHKVAEEAFRAGKTEQQIHLAYVESTGQMEHQMPYGNIVALNENGAVLHYMQVSSQQPDAHRSFLIDAGASFNGYHSDITRTYSKNNDEFADLITAMDQMQRASIDSIITNQPYAELHMKAHLQIAQILKDFNFVDMSAESMVDSGVSFAFFPHGLGHLIGLQVHDVGGQFADSTGKAAPPPKSHPHLRTTRNLEANMAYTIEPGLYFIETLLKAQRSGEYANAFNWEKIETFKPYGGIRIEDDIIIQENGVLNMTRDAFALI